jgi:cytochrome c
MPSPRNKPLIWAGAVAGVVGLLIVAQLADSRYEASDLRRKVEAMTGGDPKLGQAAFSKYSCGGCHAMSGVPGAHGTVGPPLDGIAARAIIGGRLENRPDTMMQWLRDPQHVSPGTAMPNLGVTPKDARDITAFLYTSA